MTPKIEVYNKLKKQVELDCGQNDEWIVLKIEKRNLKEETKIQVYIE